MENEENNQHPITPQALALVITHEKNNPGAAFTVRSRQTGTDYTFKISRREYNGKWYTHVKVEQGYLTFSKAGHYTNGQIYFKREPVRTPAANAIAWLLRQVEKQNFDYINANVELMHFGKCVICGKPLTDATSIEIGIGPVCRGKQE